MAYMNNCPHCKATIPDCWNFPRCPYCGNELPVAANESASVVSLGDANAISGGVHVDSHNVVTNNITHVERDKTEGELLQEKIVKYKTLCQQVYADGRVDANEARQLEDLRITLGLDETTAAQLQEQARKLRMSQSMNQLNPVARLTLNQVTALAKAGKTEMLRQSLPRLEALAKKFAVDEVQFYYYLLLSAIDTDRCIAEYESRTSDNYWQSFWTYIAYLNTEKLGEAENVLTDMAVFDSYPFGNVALLAATGSLFQYWDNTAMTDFLEQANIFMEQGSTDYSDLLDRYVQVLMLLLDSDDSNIDEFKAEFSFYFNYVFNKVMEKKKSAGIKQLIPPIPKIAPLPH